MFGTYISGPMFESAGYYAIFSASLAFATLGFLYMLIFVKESNQKQEIEPNESTTTYGTEEVQNEVHEIQPENKYCTWSDVWKSIRTVIRKRSNNRRLMIWILLFNFGCFIFAYNGSEGTHRYLFTKLQYGWNEQQYTVILTAYKECKVGFQYGSNLQKLVPNQDPEHLLFRRIVLKYSDYSLIQDILFKKERHRLPF